LLRLRLLGVVPAARDERVSSQPTSAPFDPGLLPFVPPREPPSVLVPVACWNQQASPTLMFGLPGGWAEVSREHFDLFPVEQERREVLILANSRIFAAAEHAGSGGRPWLAHLRLHANPLASYVIQNPVLWAMGKIGSYERVGDPLRRTVAGAPASLIRYAYLMDESIFVLYEAWLSYAGGGYHFMCTALAADEASLWLDWETMLATAQAHRAPQ
jgi:hypothetical protein